MPQKGQKTRLADMAKMFLSLMEKFELHFLGCQEVLSGSYFFSLVAIQGLDFLPGYCLSHSPGQSGFSNFFCAMDLFGNLLKYMDFLIINA